MLKKILWSSGLEHHMQFMESLGRNLLDAVGVEKGKCCGSF
jgi:hypothetical protein